MKARDSTKTKDYSAVETKQIETVSLKKQRKLATTLLVNKLRSRRREELKGVMRKKVKAQETRKIRKMKTWKEKDNLSFTAQTD